MTVFNDITDREFVMLRERYGDLVLEDPLFAKSMVLDLRREELNRMRMERSQKYALESEERILGDRAEKLMALFDSLPRSAPMTPEEAIKKIMEF